MQLADTILTHHAAIRSPQRSLPQAARQIVYTYGDIFRPERNGCQSVQLSRKAAEEACADGCDRTMVRKACCTVLILDPAGSALVTPIRCDVSAYGRRRRKTRARSRR